ncbi:Serine/threonine-protein kinase PrkC [Planctomycetes bacterium Poly30]|uniref:Serine/threonine-protein kinase PrkC n=1 Tax=Saltatorellus ferox TaxID=2528018 RepID=A0A518EYR3_9BACT|nr:Serine/threonine-protein kinase PrkC [Planctomycetes bacterium Poly30]
MPSFPASQDDLDVLFDEALSLDETARAAYVERISASRPALGAELRELLDAHLRGLSLLDRPLDLEPLLEGIRDESESTAEARRARRPEDLVGSMCGDLAVVRLIGSGGMGHVYEALQERPRRRVALKVLVDESRAGERFRIEAEALARLDHPNIARVFGAGLQAADAGAAGAGAYSWMAFEHIAEAQTITEYASQQRLGLEDRLRLFVPVARAIQHAHQKGVLHRDLKPANLLVAAGGEGHVKVIDFGLARLSEPLTEEDKTRTRHGELLGTLRYMSPEQCAGDPARVDVRSDVYGLGVVLYELLTGELPYDLEGSSLLHILETIRNTPARDPRALAGSAEPVEVPDEDLTAVILAALEKDPDERTRSAEALADDLERWLRREPVHARRASAFHRVRLLARRRRGLFVSIAMGAAAAVVAVGIITVLFFDNRAKVKRIEAQEDLAARRAAEIGEAREQLSGLQMRLDSYDWLYDRYGFEAAGGVVDEAVSGAGAATTLEEKRAVIELAVEKLRSLTPILGSDLAGAESLANAFMRVGHSIASSWGSRAPESQTALEAYREAARLARQVHAANSDDDSTRRWLARILTDQAEASRKAREFSEGRATIDEAIALVRHDLDEHPKSADVIELLIAALNVRGDLHIDHEPYRQGLVDSQESLQLIDELAKLGAPEAVVLDLRSWAELRIGHWLKREGPDPRGGAEHHRRSRQSRERLLDAALARESTDGVKAVENEASLTLHVFGGNELTAFARLGDQEEVNRTLASLVPRCERLLRTGAATAVLDIVTVLLRMNADRAKDPLAFGASEEALREQWKRLGQDRRAAYASSAREWVSSLEGFGQDMASTRRFLTSVESVGE